MIKNNYHKGLMAELKAFAYLRFKGWVILEKRFKTSVGEIDLIAKDGDVVVFIEVKLRKTMEAAAESIHARNQARVRRAAELYLQKYPEYTGCELRFDALVMAPGAWPEHIPNAF
jgi:putative endonuclease